MNGSGGVARLSRRIARFVKGLGVVTEPHIACEVQVITLSLRRLEYGSSTDISLMLRTTIRATLTCAVDLTQS